MAARKLRLKHQDDYKFYVYDILSSDGEVIYTGKGSGKRMFVSKRQRNGASCIEVARFYDELSAYAYEVERISEIRPILNKHKGGNGSLCGFNKQPIGYLSKEFKLMSQIGTRAYAARMLISYYNAFKHLESKVDAKSMQLKKAYTKEVADTFNSLNISKLMVVANG